MHADDGESHIFCTPDFRHFFAFFFFVDLSFVLSFFSSITNCMASIKEGRGAKEKKKKKKKMKKAIGSSTAGDKLAIVLAGVLAAAAACNSSVCSFQKCAREVNRTTCTESLSKEVVCTYTLYIQAEGTITI